MTVPGGPALPAGTVAGFFHATPELATNAPALLDSVARAQDMAQSKKLAEKLQAAGVTWEANMSPETLAKLDAIVKDDPETQRLAESHRAVAALNLELKDAGGAVVPTAGVMIQPWPPLPPHLLTVFIKAGLEVSDRVLIAMPKA